MSDAKHTSEIAHKHRRVDPRSVSVWILAILIALVAVNALLLLAVPFNTPVTGETEDEFQADKLRAARMTGAGRSGGTGLILTAIVYLLVSRIKRVGTARAWRQLLWFLGVVWGVYAAAAILETHWGDGTWPDWILLMFPYSALTAGLFFALWLPVWAAVRDEVWLEDPMRVERVFD